MSYQVIARKYRPQRFSDVVGQDHVTQTLGNAIRQQRIAHAYLFCGPRGTGKTTIARIFAKCLNCTNGPSPDFPADDPRCIEIAEGRSLDVLEIDGASNRGIEEVRELRETVRYAPSVSRFKIYIIDEVHMLTKEAFNALLKTLEEPPAHVKFLFATTEPEKVLQTILSRCQRFDLRRIPSALIVKHLALIAGQENVQIDDAALHAVARGADGGLRDAESTLDQLISFCGNTIQEADVLSMFGLAARNQILALSDAILQGDAPGALRLVSELASQGKEFPRLLSELLLHFRNLLVFKTSGGDSGLLEASESEAALLKAQAGRVETEPLLRVLETLTASEGRLRDASSKRIFVEVTLLKAIEARGAVSLNRVLERLHELRGNSVTASTSAYETRPATTATPTRAPVSSAPVAPASPAPPKAPAAPAPAASGLAAPPLSYQFQPAKPAAPIASAGPQATTASAAPLEEPHLNSERIDPGAPEFWPTLVESIGRASPFARSYFVEAFLVSFEKKLMLIGFDPEFADKLPLVDNPKNHALVQTKLKEMGHPNCSVKFVIQDAPGPARAARPAPVAEEEDTPPWTTQPAPAAPKATAPPAAAAPPALPAPLVISKDDFKNDPLIQKALEVFKGQIVDVRG